MPVTAKDIARQLDLSQPTVSRILSGTPGHRVAEGTRQRVLETAQRLGYQPNAVARSLRRGRTGIIGLYTNHDYDARNDFLSAIIGSLQRACETRGLDLLLHSALRDRSPERMYGKLRDGRIDGLILHANADDPLVEILGRSPLPVVAIADCLPNLPSVTCDDADGMRLLIAHLWTRGYRRFAMLIPEDALASVERRQNAFVSELARYDVGAADGAVSKIHGEQAAPVLDTLLADDRPRAVCCWNDRTAYALLAACNARGVSVPERIAITGFDGFRDDKAPARQLVTVGCPWEQVAATALRRLISQIEGEPCEDSETCLPVTLIAGDTA